MAQGPLRWGDGDWQERGRRDGRWEEVSVWQWCSDASKTSHTEIPNLQLHPTITAEMH